MSEAALGKSPGRSPREAAGGERDETFPPGIPFIVGNEGAERFSYYGMRAILYVYLTALYTGFVAEHAVPAELAASAKARSTAVAHLFMAGVYAFPMLGAILADRWLGKFRVILYVSLVYCAGHAVLAVAGRLGAQGNYALAEQGMYVGLTLIAIGAGGIKPCVSANVGDQFTAKNGHLVSRVFQIFYFIINFGSFFSTLLTPLFYAWFGAEVAFGVPGVMMALATVVFWLGRKRFVRVPPNPGGQLGLLDFASSALLFSPVVALIVAVFVEGEHYRAPDASGGAGLAFYWEFLTGYLAHLARSSWHYFAVAAALVAIGFALFGMRQRRRPDDGFLAVLSYALRNRSAADRSGFAAARARFGDEAAEGPPAVLRLVVVFSSVSVFWALFDQHASTWIEQAKLMDRSLVVPHWPGRAALAITVVLALYGGVRLMLWISNRPPPRGADRALVALCLAALAGSLLLHAREPVWTALELKPAQLAALNPLMVMLIIPLVHRLIDRPLAGRGQGPRPLVKMAIGMFISAAAFAAAALLQARVEELAGSGGSVHVLWQIAQYLIMTTAEVLVSVTGLEFAYTQAPRRMKSTIMGFWLLGVTFGNVLVAFLAPLQALLTLSRFFWVFTALMAAAALVFSLVAYTYRGKTYLQADS